MKSIFNAPKKVIYCSKCVMSNQRPMSIPEFLHKKNRKGAGYLNLSNPDLVCDACRYSEVKKKIDWKKREKELLKLLDKYRSKGKDYDCLVPGSGGKDSIFASHILKHKYGMNPLTVTWSPILYTEYGYKNYLNWVEKGSFDNIHVKQNGEVMKKLTKLSIENLLHPFQTFILGQKNLAPKIAKNFNINLVFYGESEAEYGNPIAENNASLRKKSYFSMNKNTQMHLAGLSLNELKKKHNLDKKDLSIFFPIENDELKSTKINIHYLGYYLKWLPQENYYYSVENCDFKPRPFRTQGTYSKYNSIDDKIDDLHYYTTFIKYGIGRASYDASQEIRNDHLTRDEGKTLVKRFDGEFPDKYFNEVMDYLRMKPKDFLKLCDKFRSPHLWKKVKGEFKLRHTVNKDGTDD
tara:strand:+ start:184 stop:1404 length:1221 start_codon:yes stop_codon:yes gene_type:complete